MVVFLLPDAVVLRVLYVITTLLCLFMVSWTLLLPAAYKIGWPGTEDHLATLNEFLHQSTTPPYIPKTLFSKWIGEYTIQLCHFLPGAFWAGLIPIQLWSPTSTTTTTTTTTFRLSKPFYHRYLGYIFFTSSALMIVGYCAIRYRNKTFSNADFPELPQFDVGLVDGVAKWFFLSLSNSVATAVPRTEEEEGNSTSSSSSSSSLLLPEEFSLIELVSIHRTKNPLVLMDTMMIWFTYTTLKALWTVMIRKHYKRHRYWVIRHIGSGLWIVVNRFKDSIPPLVQLTLPHNATRTHFRQNFFHSMCVAIALTVTSAEFGILCLKRIDDINLQESTTARKNKQTNQPTNKDQKDMKVKVG